MTEQGDSTPALDTPHRRGGAKVTSNQNLTSIKYSALARSQGHSIRTDVFPSATQKTRKMPGQQNPSIGCKQAAKVATYLHPIRRTLHYQTCSPNRRDTTGGVAVR